MAARLIVLLALALVPAAPALAQPPPVPPSDVRSLEATPRELHPGQRVAIAGQGCGPRFPVQLQLFTPELRSTGSLTAGPQGHFAAAIEIPPDVPIGRAWLRASCESTGGAQRVFEATLTLVRPLLVVTWVNVLFGLGTALFAAGFGLAIRRRPRRSRLTQRHRRGRGRRRHRR